MTNLAEIGRVLRHRDFRWLWLAQTASFVGDGIVFVALGLYIVGRGGRASELGAVLAARAVPLVVLLPVGGVWADRLPRHRVMIATDLTRLTMHGVLAALIFAGDASIGAIIALGMPYTAAEAFFQPAASGVLPQTVPERDIQPATAIVGISRNVSQFAGPALATALVIGAGAGWAFALDAATFAVSALCLARVRPRRRGDGPPRPRLSVWAEIREGGREVRAHTWVWATLACFCVAVFCGVSPWFVLGPVVARQRYGHISVYGLAEAALGLGTIAGAFAGVAWRPRHPMRAAMLAVLAWPLAGILFAVGTPLAAVVPAYVLAGVGFALFDVWWMTALAERIAPDRLSRVTSYDWMVSLALLPLGYALAGPLAATLGAPTVLGGGLAISLAAFAAGLLPRQTRRLERLPGDEPRAEAGPALAGRR